MGSPSNLGERFALSSGGYNLRGGSKVDRDSPIHVTEALFGPALFLDLRPVVCSAARRDSGAVALASFGSSWRTACVAQILVS